MSRMFQVLLVLVLLFGSGCGSVKDFFNDENGSECEVKPAPAKVSVEPEGIVKRKWDTVEVSVSDSSYYKSSPYFDSYEKLDDSQYDDAGDPWTKSNAKRAVIDPLKTIRDAVVAPFKYSKDKYKDYKAKKEAAAEKQD